MSYFVELVDDRLTTLLTPARRAWLRRPRTLLFGFLGLHVLFLFALLPTILTGRVLGDLPLYRVWAEQALVNGVWQGVDVQWVYPIGAIVPVVLADAAGPLLYQLLWFIMTMALNAAAIGILTDWGRNRAGYKAAWFWLAFSLLLSPVGLLRLEGLSAPLVIMGLVLLARRPVVAAALLTVATWIKVWPAAVVLAILAAGRRRVSVVVTGAVITAAIAATVWAAGGLRFLTGFITMQSDRALQLEAPVTTPWVWLAAMGQHGTTIYQNHAIATREVSGPGAGVAAAAMTPLMFLTVAAIFVLMLLALRRSRDTAQLVLVGALALVTTFVVLNKVGSPQYMLWIAPVVAVGIAHDWARWRVPAYLTLVIGGLTTLIFPIFYLPLVHGDAGAVLLLTLRNGLLVVLLGWSVAALWSTARLRAPASVLLSRRANSGLPAR
ncbi:glycosyltransferase 87 family protein [Cryobacterium sp. SO2]|uniref:glycosyltransferase 87 family protein n=1 Tax=Cryobacterium sp. SO2 TaxID=1897060 RepID=UPI00223E2A4F|nr:glycosyltransferase 87 family protein [Cryobacterium sp. SO2]WEO77225.1 glycosyltransferase 87 family protein [Cryobacterium sp. SO2]